MFTGYTIKSREKNEMFEKCGKQEHRIIMSNRDNRPLIVFEVFGNSSWIGGLYYYRNILFELTRNPLISGKYHICAICEKQHRELFRYFDDKIETRYIKSEVTWIRRFMRLWWLIKADKVYNYGYQGVLGKIFKKKAIYWIPDFQEIFYPQFFSKDDLSDRKNTRNSVAESGQTTILSSTTCKKHFLNNFCVKSKERVFVVPFVSAIDGEARSITLDAITEVKQKYSIENKYIFIANQFWQHKNHKVVFEAIEKAQDKNLLSDIIFVFTGNMKDDRSDEYIVELQNIIKRIKKQEAIRVLGFISRKDQLALMAGSEFLIQPSLFEGWGTVVEDAKVLDKTIVLSDIEVHREQMNEKCILFDPMSADDLLDKISIAMNHEPDNIDYGIHRMYEDAERYSQHLLEALDASV